MATPAAPHARCGAHGSCSEQRQCEDANARTPCGHGCADTSLSARASRQGQRLSTSTCSPAIRAPVSEPSTSQRAPTAAQGCRLHGRTCSQAPSAAQSWCRSHAGRRSPARSDARSPCQQRSTAGSLASAEAHRTKVSAAALQLSTAAASTQQTTGRSAGARCTTCADAGRVWPSSAALSGSVDPQCSITRSGRKHSHTPASQQAGRACPTTRHGCHARRSRLRAACAAAA